MAGPAPTCAHDHDRVRLLASPTPEGRGSEKKELSSPAATEPTSYQADDLDPAQSAAAQLSPLQ